MTSSQNTFGNTLWWLSVWFGIGIVAWSMHFGPTLLETLRLDLAALHSQGLDATLRFTDVLEWLLFDTAADVVEHGYGLGACLGLLLLALNLDGRSWLKPLLASLSLLALLPVLAYLAVITLGQPYMSSEPGALKPYLAYWLFAASAGLLLAFLLLRHGVSQLEILGRRLTKHSALERNRRTDVRQIDQFLPSEIGAFDPLKYVDARKGLFIGLDETCRPVYIAEEDWRLSHLLLTGRTRAGKGVAAQILLTQAIQRKELVVILDPKGDAWLPHICHREASRAGQPYHFLDLRPGAPAQINLFQGCDAEAVENMLIGAFSLAEKGEAADFYRLKDRKAARDTARFLAEHQRATPTDILAEFGTHWSGEAEGFLAALQEMAELPAVNRADGQGIDIAALEKTGGCLYVVGDMGNSRIVRMQRMLLMRLMMLAKQRDTLQYTPRTITVFADEFKVHISRPFITSLGAAAGWGMHCILAFQSLQDLADVPADLDKDAVRGAVMENCAIQLSYRIKDPETAEWLAASTGTILVDDEIRSIDKNIALTETVSHERTVRQAERYLVDTNMLMNLPKGCGVLVGARKLPVFCYTSPVAVERLRGPDMPTTAVEQSNAERGHQSGWIDI